MTNELNANPANLILWFDDFGQENPYSFLSNFYRGNPLVIGGHSYPTGEHAFQAAKAKGPKVHELIRTADDPSDAKYYGRNCELRPDWEAVKYDVMAAVLRVKFRLSRVEGAALLDTGDALLVEGTYWGDQVWGVDLKPHHARFTPTEFGRNWLGTLLMARRAELKYEERTGTTVRTAERNVAFAWPFQAAEVGG